MNSQLTQSLLPYLGLMVIASIASCLIYILLRLLENRFLQMFSDVSIGSIAIVFLWAMTVSDSSFLISILVICLFVGLIGGWIHRNSGGKSESQFAAAFFMLTVVVGIIGVEWLILRFIPVFGLFSDITQKAISTHQYWFFALIATQIIAPPFLIWVWKSSRLRPGIDKHFDD